MPKKPPFKIAAERNTAEIKAQELFTEVGRAIVHLSDIENWLGDIFHSLVNHQVEHKVVVDLFYGQTLFDNKMLLVELLIGLEGVEELKERWQKIKEELKNHRGVRNLIAHQGMYVGYPDEDVALHPAPLRLRYDPTTKCVVPSKGRRLGIADVRSTANALDRIRRDLENFWIEVDERFLPEKQRSDYVEKDEDD